MQSEDFNRARSVCPIQSEMNRFIERVQKQQKLYTQLLDIYSNSKKRICRIEDPLFLEDILAAFGPCLAQREAKIDLQVIYEAAFHPMTQALIVASRGVTLLCSSPQTATPYVLQHIACSVYYPHLGQETVNIGLVGNIYEGQVILRSESACIPSFLFGSQRCNCCYQWASVRELAAHLNPIQQPSLHSDEEYEKWIQTQFTYRNGQYIPFKSGPGLILIHLDSQSGMGSGFTAGEFVYSLFDRALLRQIGGNAAERAFNLSIKESYQALGLQPDARLENHKSGYQIPSLILDWLGSSQDIIYLSNNRHKLDQLMQNGYQLTRVKSLGAIHSTGLREITQRKADFDYLDMDEIPLSFEEEMKRLKQLFIPL